MPPEDVYRVACVEGEKDKERASPANSSDQVLLLQDSRGGEKKL